MSFNIPIVRAIQNMTDGFAERRVNQGHPAQGLDPEELLAQQMQNERRMAETATVPPQSAGSNPTGLQDGGYVEPRRDVPAQAPVPPVLQAGGMATIPGAMARMAGSNGVQGMPQIGGPSQGDTYQSGPEDIGQSVMPSDISNSGGQATAPNGDQLEAPSPRLQQQRRGLFQQWDGTDWSRFFKSGWGGGGGLITGAMAGIGAVGEGRDADSLTAAGTERSAQQQSFENRMTVVAANTAYQKVQAARAALENKGAPKGMTAQQQQETNVNMADYDTQLSKMDEMTQYIDDPNNGALTGVWAGTGGQVMDRIGVNGEEGVVRQQKRNEMKQWRVDMTLANTAKTKGAITEKEMALFKSPLPEFYDDPRLWSSGIKERRKALQTIRDRIANGITVDFATGEVSQGQPASTSAAPTEQTNRESTLSEGALKYLMAD